MSISKKLIMASGGKKPLYADDVFSTYLYTGTNSAQNITNGIDLAGEGGLVWLKNRSLVVEHRLIDTERGISTRLESDTTVQEYFQSGQFVTGFNSDGFTVGGSETGANDGYTPSDYASWTFRKAPDFFDVVTYTGTGVAGNEIPHNLGSTPGMIIVKSVDQSSNWSVYHRSTPTGVNGSPLNLILNGNNFANPAGSSDFWTTAPTDTIFTLGDSDVSINTLNSTYVAYLFAHDTSDESIIKCGSYTGNGTTNGPEIDLGWEPQWLLIKNATSSSNWMMVDNMRGLPVGGDDETLSADTNHAENGVIGNVAAVDILPNGWKNVGGITASNSAGDTHIYMAIRRPNKPADEFEAEELFAMSPRTAGPGKYPFFSDFPVDMGMMRNRTASQSMLLGDRLRSAQVLQTADTAIEYNDSKFVYDAMESAAFGYTALGAYTAWQSWMFRRAPGFFDVVAYNGAPTGTGSGGAEIIEIPHNLGVVPELKIIKVRNTDFGWLVGGDVVRKIPDPNSTGANDNPYGWGSYLYLDADSKVQHSTGFWPEEDTATILTHNAGNGFQGGAAYDYIAYLFASVPGISKVGSYTGTGAEIDVDCAFTTGARFVMIKRTDSTGDWYFWDTDRGITAGNDPYLLFNTTATEVAGTDYIDPLSSGFKVTASAPADINASGGEYIFYAIA